MLNEWFKTMPRAWQGFVVSSWSIHALTNILRNVFGGNRGILAGDMDVLYMQIMSCWLRT